MSWLYDLFSPLPRAIAQIVLWFHSLLSPVFGEDSGWAWGLSIVLLTMTMRLLMVPLFVKQIKSQRAMQVLQPQLAELRKKYGKDRERLQRETMKLYKDNNASLFSGCLPLLLQIPVFFALFSVLNGIRVKGGEFVAHAGMSAAEVESAANAQVFGAPIAAAFNATTERVQFLGGDLTTVRIVAVVMTVLMGLSTYWTQKQMMARSKASGAAASNPQFEMQQKILLYVLPLSFIFLGFSFPIGVLLYTLTTNMWTLAQQHLVLSRMPEPGKALVTTASRPATAAGAADGRTGTQVADLAPDSGAIDAPTRSQSLGRQAAEARTGGRSSSGARGGGSTAANRRAPSGSRARKGKNRRGGRR
ncbi:MAG: membrane protein insertase YidC [Actinomycetota bacterium]|nr:membrane protein insertase YidC [Actinomycetota bacterium]